MSRDIFYFPLDHLCFPVMAISKQWQRLTLNCYPGIRNGILELKWIPGWAGLQWQINKTGKPLQLTLSSEPHDRDWFMPKQMAFLNNANRLYTVDISYNFFSHLRRFKWFWISFYYECSVYYLEEGMGKWQRVIWQAIPKNRNGKRAPSGGSLWWGHQRPGTQGSRHQPFKQLGRNGKVPGGELVSPLAPVPSIYQKYKT